MARVPGLDDPQNPFGPDDPGAPRAEKYDTRYIVASFKKAELLPKLFIGSIVGLLLLAVILWLVLSEPKVQPGAARPTPAASDPGAAPSTP